MQYTIENEILSLTVDTHGAEMVSLIHKATGAQLLWNAGEAWNRHAPILFPYTGKVLEGKFTVDGVEYAGGQHGFARDMEHEMTALEKDAVEFALCSSPATLEKFPFPFVLRTRYTLDGATVRHSVKVENPGEGVLRFGLGFHPGFACPFDADHDTQDYEFRFDTPQSPLVQETPVGFCTGTHRMMENSAVIPLTDRLFDNDSICMTDLTARTLSLVEKDTGRRVEVKIQGFPYVLIWSALTEKIQFVCIEPWHSLPDRADASGRWEEKPCAAALAPGQSWQTSLDMTFVR